MPTQQFLSSLFDTNNYNLHHSQQKLRQFGGISSLLNSMSIDHRQIANLYKDHGIDGRVQGKQRKMVKDRKVQMKQPQLQSMLLYLTTLSFFIKLLLVDNEIQREMNIYTQMISFVFLIFIISQKKTRTKPIEQQQMEQQVQCRKIFKIRRNGYQKYIQNQLIIQGDIVLLTSGDIFKFSGIILDIPIPSNYQNQAQDVFITVTEEQTGTYRNKCKKYTVWKYQQSNLDPFLLANSRIISGSAWMLVCCPPNYISPKRNKVDAQLAGLLRLSAISQQVTKIIRLAVVLLVVYLSLIWISVEALSPYKILVQLIYLISCLTLYLSYINTSEILNRLHKLLQKNRGQGYKILNGKLLQKLIDVDLVIIESDCININKEMMPKLTYINTLIDVKIITTNSIQNIESIFGDINSELLFHPSQDSLLRLELDKLQSSIFISISHPNIFRQYYLQLLSNLRYNMIYITNNRQAIGLYEDIITMKCSNLSCSSGGNQQMEWVRIYQSTDPTNVLIQLIQKANKYKQFQQGFYTVIINNCLQITMLIGWALAGCLVDLNLNLLIIFINRNRVKQFYEGLSGENREVGVGQARNKKYLIPIQINLIFFMYYIYMNWQIYQSKNRQFQLFLVLMANRIFRVEALVKQQNSKLLLNRLLKKSGIILGLIMSEAFLKWQLGYRSDFVSQSLDILLLPLIIMIFVLFL